MLSSCVSKSVCVHERLAIELRRREFASQGPYRVAARWSADGQQKTPTSAVSRPPCHVECEYSPANLLVSVL